MSGAGILVIAMVSPFAAFALIAIYNIQANKKRSKEVARMFNNLENFTNHDCYLAGRTGPSVAVDRTNKKICFIDKDNIPAFFEYNQILRCDLIYNSKLEKPKSALSVGTLNRSDGTRVTIIGEVGAPFGYERLVTSLGINIMFNAPKYPTYRIMFVIIPQKENTAHYRGNYADAERWYTFFSNLVNTFSPKSDRPYKLPADTTIAQELRELKDLFDDGVLTKEEFELQKKRVLSLRH